MRGVSEYERPSDEAFSTVEHPDRGRGSTAGGGGGGDGVDNSRRSRTTTGGRVSVSASELFPGLEQRTFFCSALAAAALKAVGVISPDLNDNYFWPGAFAEGKEIDDEAAQMSYCYTREVLINVDTPAVAKLVQLNTHGYRMNQYRGSEYRHSVYVGDDDRDYVNDEDEDDDDVASAPPGSLFQFT